MRITLTILEAATADKVGQTNPGESNFSKSYLGHKTTMQLYVEQGQKHYRTQ